LGAGSARRLLIRSTYNGRASDVGLVRVAAKKGPPGRVSSVTQRQMRRAAAITTFPVMPSIELTEDQAAALLRALDEIIREDRYFLSPLIRALTAIRDQLRPPPVREPLPPLRNYEPPGFIQGRRRRW
jgi:hypothetical protein